MSRKVFSLVLIVLLTLSSIGMANSDIMASGSLDVKKTEVSPVQEVTTANLSSHPSKKVEVDLSESVGITSDSPKAQPQNQVSNSSPELPSVKTQVSLSESLSIHDNSPAKGAFLVLKQNSDSVTTMDRISSLDRVRFNGKSIVVNDPYAADKMITEPIMILANSETHIGKILFQDVGTAFEKTGAGMLNYVSHAGYLSSIQDSVRYLSGGMEVAGGSMSGIVHDSANGKNPAMFLLLVPLSGYILIRAEGTRLRVSNTRQIFSLFFIAILISSAVIVPISSSAGYLAYAYSQANNSSINSANSNQSNSSSPLSFNGYSNSTQKTSSSVGTTNSTKTSNSTQTTSGNSTLSFNGYSNSTQATNSNSTLSFNDYSNSTQATSNPTESPSLPKSTQSWEFGSQTNGTTTVGEIDLANQTNKTVLQLQGNGFLKSSGSSTKDLKDLTISAWVKPDYTQGSPVFTVISKEKEFTLSINSLIPPYQTAEFSVFDGIRWDTVNSTVPIGQSWNSLAATFNGSSISLYVNGTLKSSMPITGIPAISVNGKLATKNSTNLSSDADIVIGAYYNSIRQKAENQFSGLLSNVNLYDSLLTPAQISQVYSQSLSSFYPTSVSNISNSTLAQITNSTDQLTPEISNSTQVSNSTTTNSTVIARDNVTSANVTGIVLQHDNITLNNPVIWYQNVTLTNSTKDVAIELPADAQILDVQASNNTSPDNIYVNQTGQAKQDLPTQPPEKTSKQAPKSGVPQNATGRIDIVENKTDDTGGARQDLSLVPKNTTIASLKDKIPQMVQTGKPLKLLMVNETAKEYSVKYQTPAPYTVENVTSTPSTYQKSVIVTHNSTLHYTNVTAFSNIPEDLVKKGVPFKLYWKINGTKTDVTKDPRFNVKFVDTNNNGIPDQMQWTVPKLSEQDFVIVAQITVINVQSYPIQGGNWTVFFNTTGTADLNITAINGTQFGTAAPADLKFLLVNNGTQNLNATVEGNSVIIHNYSSNETGSEVSHVITSGKHHLMFQFGSSVAYANNNAFKTNVISVHTPLSVTFDSSGNFVYGNPDFVSKSDANGTLLYNSTDLNYFGVAVNSTGYTYAADPNSNQIDIYSPSWSVVGHVGSGGADGSNNTQFASPIGVAIDTSNNLYVTDVGNDRVQEFDSHGNYLRTFGSSGTGNGQFEGPMGVAVNGTGYVYVTDAGNNRTEIFSPTATFVSSFGAAGGGSGNNQFNTPTGIAIDKFFNEVYVADVNNDRIQKFDKNGNYEETLTQGFDGPVSVAVDSNNFVYVADSGNDLIKKFETDLKVLQETVGLSDSLDAHMSTLNLSESLGLSDGTVSTHQSAVSLSESLGLSDGTVKITRPLSLSESLSLSDTLGATASTVSLSESLGLSDGTVGVHQSEVSLSESLGLSDGTITIHPTTIQSLSDSLSLSDGTADAHQSTLNLSQSLGLSDTVSATPSAVNLSESLGLSDGTVKAAKTTVGLEESLGLSDGTVTTNPTTIQSLSDSLSLSDGTADAHQSTLNLSQSLGLSDTVSATPSAVNLSESLGLSDGTVKAAKTTVGLEESLGLSDGTVTPNPTTIKSLSDSLGLSDGTVNTRQTKTGLSLSDSLGVSDSVSFKGGMKIEARDQNNGLIPGATYSISPNPNGGSTPLIVVDGGSNDADTSNNGRSIVDLVPFGPYNVTMTTIPSGYNVLGNYTIHTVSQTNLNGTALFKVITTSTNLSTLPSTVITSAPNLNDTVLDNWKSSFNAHQHNGTQPTTQITGVSQLPPIISAGISSSSAITNAIANQATVQLETNFDPSKDPSSIIKTLGVPVYSVPKSSSVVSVIPAIVAQSASLSVPTQTVTTPPLDKIVPGQQMIIPVNSGVIPNTGGLKQLNVTSSSSTPSSTNSSSDWFVVKVDNSMPSALPALSSSGITDKLSMFINVTYNWEATSPHKGFDWSDPANFAHPPQLTLQVPKPSASSGVKTDSNGCPVSDIYLYDSSTKSWTTNTVTVISSKPTTGNSGTCDVVVQAHHFSQFALGAPVSGGSTSTSTSQGGGFTGGGGGTVGAGPSGVSAASSSAGFGGVLASALNIDSVSYNVCQNDTVKVLVEYSGDNPAVILRTSLTGVVQATPAAVQPYAQENENSTVQKIFYVAPIDPKEQSFEVVVMQAADNNVNSVGKTITITGCQETIDFENGQEVQPAQVDMSAPAIFDVKMQPGNGTASSANNNQFVSSQSVTISAIISSPTPIDQAQLRFVKAGDPVSTYGKVSMTVSPIPITNTTYAVTGTIPQYLMVSPGMTYWLDIHNAAQKTTDSDQYTVGVVPQYPITGSLQMDLLPTRAEGTTSHPNAYFINNSTGPAYGTISLIVDGSPVYTSPATVFGTGQTTVTLDWKAPTVDAIRDHQVYAEAKVYGQSYDTSTSTLTSFPSIKTLAISANNNIESLTEGNNTVASPVVLHSSFDNHGTLRYRVTAPDGTCVIGGSEGCLVTKSTFGSRGDFKVVTVGSQTYLVRYSGPDSPLERFSITSADPIVGNWKVGIDSQSDLLPSAQAAGNVFLKVKYMDTDATSVSVPSK